MTEPRIRALLSAYPEMPATVIAERIGWSRSVSWFRERVVRYRGQLGEDGAGRRDREHDRR